MLEKYKTCLVNNIKIDVYACLTYETQLMWTQNHTYGKQWKAMPK